MPFSSCHWVGQGDCAQNRCDETDVTVATDSLGDRGLTECLWRRKKSLCCEPNAGFPNDTEDTQCDGITACDLDSRYCEFDEQDGEDTPLRRRSSKSIHHDEYMEVYEMERRGNARTTQLALDTILPGLATGLTIILKSFSYPSSGELLKQLTKSKLPPLAWKMAKQACVKVTLEKLDPDDILRKAGFPTDLEMESDHIVEVQLIEMFVRTCLTGVLPSKNAAITPALNYFKLYHAWSSEPEASLPPINGGIPGTLNDRFYGALGSRSYIAPFFFLPKSMNIKKGIIFRMHRFLSRPALKELTDDIKGSRGEQNAATAKFLEGIREVPGIFSYLNDDTVSAGARGVLAALRQQAKLAEVGWGLTGMEAMWDEFEKDVLETVVKKAQTRFSDVLELAKDVVDDTSLTKYRIKKIMSELDKLSDYSGNIDLSSWKSK